MKEEGRKGRFCFLNGEDNRIEVEENDKFCFGGSHHRGLVRRHGMGPMKVLYPSFSSFPTLSCFNGTISINHTL